MTSNTLSNRKVSVCGVELTVDDTNYERFWTIFDDGTWEPETLDLIAGHADKDTTFLDIGGWIGPTSLLAAKCGQKVVALEPDPIALESFRKNLELNPDIADDITLLPMALDARKGTRELRARDSLGGDSRSSLFHRRAGKVWKVKTMTFPDVLEYIPQSQSIFLKIDIEGFEYFILPHIIDRLEDRVKYIHLSFHPKVYRKSGYFWHQPLRTATAAYKTIRDISALQRKGFHRATRSSTRFQHYAAIKNPECFFVRR